MVPRTASLAASFGRRPSGAGECRITLAHSNPVAIERGILRVDRKFHVGMLRYADCLEERVLTINPTCQAGQSIMDPIEVQPDELPYAVMCVRTRDGRTPIASDLAEVHAQIGRSALVYGGDLGVAGMCKVLHVPYILMREYDLQTKISATTLEVTGRARRLVRTARCAWRHLTADIPEIRAAQSVHCNGYPVYETARRYNSDCLLYFDSRMSREMLIAPERLRARLSANRDRPLRLLFSGRYEPFKGALDVLHVGLQCIERGLDIELHCYGQGTLREQMLRMAAARPDRLHVHAPIPFPELVELSRSFDAFICCHLQNDPSCTYLEALGSGLPVLGYANAMWRDMCQASRAGMCSRMGSPGAVAADIEALHHHRTLLAEMSERALGFARSHCFEAEFDKRIEAVSSAASRLSRAPAPSALLQRRH